MQFPEARINQRKKPMQDVSRNYSSFQIKWTVAFWLSFQQYVSDFNKWDIEREVLTYSNLAYILNYLINRTQLDPSLFTILYPPMLR